MVVGYLGYRSLQWRILSQRYFPIKRHLNRWQRFWWAFRYAWGFAPSFRWAFRHARRFARSRGGISRQQIRKFERDLQGR